MIIGMGGTGKLRGIIGEDKKISFQFSEFSFQKGRRACGRGGGRSASVVASLLHVVAPVGGLW